jgi:hypothetical protein
MQTPGFQDRAGVRSGRGFRFPLLFPRLQWQLFVRRVDSVNTGRAMKRVAENFRKSDHRTRGGSNGAPPQPSVPRALLGERHQRPDRPGHAEEATFGMPAAAFESRQFSSS